MPDAYVVLRHGEKRPVYGQAVAQTGTLTVVGVPVCTLTDAHGTVVTGYGGIAVTGFDPGTQTQPRVWLLLDSKNLPVGYYTLAFRFSALGSDGLTRIYQPTLEIEVRETTA